jgi:hypothetical protein
MFIIRLPSECGGKVLDRAGPGGDCGIGNWMWGWREDKAGSVQVGRRLEYDLGGCSLPGSVLIWECSLAFIFGSNICFFVNVLCFR